MKKVNILLISLALAAIVLSGCETKQQTGALIGAGGGAAVGSAVGGTKGALIGGAVGAGGGYLIGREMEKRDTAKEYNDDVYGYVEDENDIKWRKELLRKIGYKK